MKFNRLLLLVSRHRIPRDDWWIRLRSLARVLSTHDSVFWFDNAESTREDDSKTKSYETK